ncbi:MAG: CRTAC1 family protein [Planctomycetes bacterium]|nr:CRTAC1 family protein [Planctomycetota bacterium]
MLVLPMLFHLQDTAPKPPEPLFVERAAETLGSVLTTCGTRAKDYILEVDGGGLALADVDGDSALDLVVVDGSTIERATKGEPGFPPRLFLNDGHGKFRPAGETWAMNGGRWGMGCAVGDVDGDGWLDLAVTQWGPTRLFLNQKGKGFAEVTATAGLTGDAWGTSAAFLDYDLDGKLDLAVVNYLEFVIGKIPPPGGGCSWKGVPVMCGPEGLVGQQDQLFRNLGDGKFADVSAAAKFQLEQPGYGLGATTLDYDGDGDVDLFVGNDSTPNNLWENQGDGTFKEVGFLRGCSHDSNGREQASMGIGCADVDGDGREDLMVTTFSGENNSLFLSKRDKLFRESSFSVGFGGPSMPFLGWGTALADLDLDGDLDSFVFNGHVYPQADNPGTDTTYAQVDQLYENSGKLKFTMRPLSDGKPRVSRASTIGDLDGDGDLDLVAIQLDGEVRVLVNTTRERAPKEKTHWLAVELRAKGANRFALGAEVVAEWDGGRRGAEVRTTGGYQAAIQPRVHFGLGSAVMVKKLVVRWPSGKEQTLSDIAADRVLVIEEAPQ